MSEAEAERVLGVFAKQPIPGQVKTRLAGATSPEFAARVAEAFLRDTLDRLSVVAAWRLFAFSPPDAQPYFEETARGRLSAEPRTEGDLGTGWPTFSGTTRQIGAGRAGRDGQPYPAGGIH